MENEKMNKWVHDSNGKYLDAICLMLELFLPRLVCRRRYYCWIGAEGLHV
jgi:hypothetical protein